MFSLPLRNVCRTLHLLSTLVHRVLWMIDLRDRRFPLLTGLLFDLMTAPFLLSLRALLL